MKHIQLPIFDDAGKRVSAEAVEVEAADAGQYRLLHSPAFIDGIARNDIITVDSELPRGFQLLKRGGYLAIVLVLPSVGIKSNAERTLLPRMVRVRGVCEGGPGRALVFSIPVASGFAPVEDIFKQFCGSEAGATWWFGNVYDPVSGSPLNWWQ
jgi:hypothetical protein